MYYILLLLLFVAPLHAERITPDRGARNYEAVQPKKQRVDTFDFSGNFPELEHINIDARRKKNVELLLTGDYPLLEMVNYEGSFGVLSGKLTGHFPLLSQVNVLCTNCAMHLDLNTAWTRSCSITIRGADENVVLTLPEDVGLVIHTQIAIKGKVYPSENLKKVGKFGILKKTYVNKLAETAPVVLTIDIQVGEGHIILN